MVPFGINPVGFNNTKNRYGVHNPWNTNYYCGGATSGIAAIVSCGLTPFCIGLESIGSVRLTAGMTGMVGFKPTYGFITGLETVYKHQSPFCVV
ncbi:hypothetical protein HZS_3505, partial [Henneguya salminicola]